jgi:hypothetical protein
VLLSCVLTWPLTHILTHNSLCPVRRTILIATLLVSLLPDIATSCDPNVVICVGCSTSLTVLFLGQAIKSATTVVIAVGCCNVPSIPLSYRSNPLALTAGTAHQTFQPSSSSQ